MNKILHKEILIPKVNEYPIEKAQKWAHANYLRARAHVDKKRAKSIKEGFPLRTAEYVVEMTFGKWRLIGPPKGAAKSPLDIVLDYLKPYINPTRWSQPARTTKPPVRSGGFKKQLTLSFLIIYWRQYDPTVVKEENDKINQLLSEFALKEYDLHLDFVLHPDTAESNNSPRLLEIRSKIYLFFIGKPLDISKYQGQSQSDSIRLMDMHLDLQVVARR